MPYDSIVCVKQVPDTANITAEAMKDDGTVNRAALPTVFNPEDLNALEAALEIKDHYGGTVSVSAWVRPRPAEVLRECLYRGADRAILLTDRRAAASDTLATSYILSQAVRTVGRYDFVFCGRQAIDGDTAQVGPQLAEKLGLTQVTYLERLVSLDDGVARIRRNTGHGWEIVEGRLPLLVTVVGTANQPRPPAAKRLLRWKKARANSELAAAVKEALPEASDEQRDREVRCRADALRQRGLLLEQWDLDQISADMDRCGLAGSPTKVYRVQSIVLTKEGLHRDSVHRGRRAQLIRELVVDRTLG